MRLPPTFQTQVEAFGIQLPEYKRPVPFSFDRGVAIYGAGPTGLDLAQKLKQKNLEVHHFFDSDPQKWGKPFEGYPVSSIDEKKTDTPILIGSGSFLDISKHLKSKGLKANQDYFPSLGWCLHLGIWPQESAYHDFFPEFWNQLEGPLMAQEKDTKWRVIKALVMRLFCFDLEQLPDAFFGQPIGEKAQTDHVRLLDLIKKWPMEPGQTVQFLTEEDPGLYLYCAEKVWPNGRVEVMNPDLYEDFATIFDLGLHPLSSNSEPNPPNRRLVTTTRTQPKRHDNPGWKNG